MSSSRHAPAPLAAPRVPDEDGTIPVTRHERLVIALVTLLQFAVIMGFTMVMALGPDFAQSLDIPLDHLGYIVGSYPLAAAVGTLLWTRHADRFDRRWAVLGFLFGAALCHLIASFATGFETLLAARMLGGLFGGPAAATALAIVIDVVPGIRRGRAMGMVMGAFSVASVLGLPFALWLSEGFGWQAPFRAVALLALLVCGLLAWVLPPIRGHLDNPRSRAGTSIATILAQPNHRLGLALIATAMFSNFLVIPNLSSYLLFNLDLPREDLGGLYMIGGGLSLVGMQLTGRLCDRFGSVWPGTITCLLTALVGWAFLLHSPGPSLVWVGFGAYMLFSSARRVAQNTLNSFIPAEHERAAFTSTQSAVQHLSSAAGSYLGAALLVSSPGGALEGMPLLVAVLVVALVIQPVLMAWLARRLARRASAGSPVDGRR
ncbi:MFS transporter [Cobetia sp. 5-25-4-2]|uniref:MFS transporter n=1 Tax=Cobetia sp. 5-25-4-2 TaxID=2737459 RepID=UPI00159684E1|nr:MFS transporter [Cobetia sp. 5-25-4-2]